MAVFFIRLWREKPLGMASGIVIFIVLFVAVFGGQLAPYKFAEMNLIDRMQGSSFRHLMGTDQMGRDVLSRVIFGARVSVLVGLAVTTLSVLISTLVGGISGFVGGRFDILVQRVVDAWMCFPGLLLLLTLMSIVGKGATDNTGARDSRGHRRIKSDPRRRHGH